MAAPCLGLAARPTETNYFRHYGNPRSRYDFEGGWLPVAGDIDSLEPDTRMLVAEFESGAGRVWDNRLIPIYAVGNGDYVCLRSDEGPGSGVSYWDHEAARVRVLTPSLAEFLQTPDWFP
jgi:hypothetical protein